MPASAVVIATLPGTREKPAGSTSRTTTPVVVPGLSVVVSVKVTSSPMDASAVGTVAAASAKASFCTSSEAARVAPSLAAAA